MPKRFIGYYKDWKNEPDMPIGITPEVHFGDMINLEKPSVEFYLTIGKEGTTLTVGDTRRLRDELTKALDDEEAVITRDRNEIIKRRNARTKQNLSKLPAAAQAELMGVLSESV